MQNSKSRPVPLIRTAETTRQNRHEGLTILAKNVRQALPYDTACPQYVRLDRQVPPVCSIGRIVYAVNIPYYLELAENIHSDRLGIVAIAPCGILQKTEHQQPNELRILCERRCFVCDSGRPTIWALNFYSSRI